MDASRLQKLTTLVTESGTRRTLVQGGLAVLGLGALALATSPDEADAGKKSRRKKKSRRQRRRNQNQGSNPVIGGNTPSPVAGADNPVGDFRASPCTRICATGCDYTSVQAAIDATSDGGTLVVCSGTFIEDLTITRNLTLAAVTGGELVLAGTGTTSVVTLPNQGVNVTFQHVAIGKGIGTPVDDKLYGGGIFNFSNLTLIGCDVGQNTADNGGGIYNYSNLSILGETLVAYNSARLGGGGIFNEGMVTIGGQDSQVSNNQADQGGGIYNNGSGITLNSGASVSSNTSTGDGGGIYNNGSPLTIDAAFVQDNTAGGNGGGIYKSRGAAITLRNGAVIDDNTAQNGGGVYNLGAVGGSQPPLNVIDSAISHNKAEEAGGGIFNDDGAVSLQSATVFQNSSGGPGGGIFNTDGGAVTSDAESAVFENTPNNCIGTTACTA